MLITRTSPISGKINTLDLPITEEQVVAYLNGTFVQKAFPNLTADQREFIKSGITKEEWDRIFPEEDEDDIPNGEQLN